MVYALWAASIGWHNTILDFIGFRQAQTALTTYFMIGRPPQLAYETPVVGPPWSIPFEFPLYEWIVAAIVTLFHTGLDETGRFVNLSFFLLSLIPAYRILIWIGIEREHRFLAMCLYVVSPLYVFWSRTFLIESTALFFSLSYLVAALVSVDGPRTGRLVLATSLGVVAALVKITTFFVFLPLVALYLGYVHWHAYRHQAPPHMGRNAALSLLLLVVPFTAGLLWTQFADSQKALNPIGRRLASKGDVMREWNYGSFEQRLRPQTWGTIGYHAERSIGHAAVLALAAVATAITRRRRQLFSVCLLAWPIVPLLITNLYEYHEYYAYANAILLVAAVALALVGLLEHGGVYRKIAYGGLALCLALAVWRYQDYYVPIQTTNHRELEAVCRSVQDLTRPDDAIVVIGCDWSSEVPYYCRRRALCLPWWEDPSLNKMPDYLALKAPRVGAVVIRNENEWERFEPAEVQNAIRSAGHAVRHVPIDELFDVYLVDEEPIRPSAE